MKALKELTKAQLSARAAELQEQYDAYKARGLKLDMSRGKPGPEQLDLTLDMLECVNEREGYKTADGVDTRNYGLLDGIPEVKSLFGDILGMEPANIIVGGNSSVNLIYDALVRAILHGPLPGDTPWKAVPRLKFICPSARLPVMIGTLP